MEYHAQPRSHELPTVSEISPQQFYARFKVTGDATFAHLLHPKFRFVVDGFAAAVVLAENSVLDRADADDDKEVRKLLLGRQVLPDDLIVESLIVPSDSLHPAEQRRYQASLESVGKTYWDKTCEELHVRKHHELTLQTTSNHQRNLLRTINVRFHEPLALPFSPAHSQLALYVPPAAHLPLNTLLSNPTLHPLIPKSAIFFASRFHKLRELGVRHGIIEKALKEQHAVPVRDRYAVKDLETVLEEIYRVLLSTALYSTAIFGSHDGPDRLGFSAEEWIETYEMGDRHGSEVFGTREGIEVNGKFLLECHEQLEIWDKQAVELWCPGQDAQDEYDRELLLSVLAEMETGLLGIFEEIHEIRHPRNRQARSRSASPYYNPFSADHR